jgi:hypothetical protein
MFYGLQRVICGPASGNPGYQTRSQTIPTIIPHHQTILVISTLNHPPNIETTVTACSLVGGGWEMQPLRQHLAFIANGFRFEK